MKTRIFNLSCLRLATAAWWLLDCQAGAQRVFTLNLAPTNQNAVAVIWKAQSATPIGDLFIVPQFQVQRSADLQTWMPISGMITGAVSQKLSFTDPQGGLGFYRVSSTINQEYAQLENVILDNGQLQFADFFGAQLYKASLQNATLTNASFAGANAQEADFAGADLSGADLFGVEALGAVFDSGSLAGVDAGFGDFEAASLFNVDFTGANLSSALLTGADLDFATFNHTIIDTNTVMDPKPMRIWRLVNLGATNAVLTNLDLSNARLENVSFNGARLNNTTLNQSFLSNDDLRGANMTGASTNLDFVDLHGALMDSTTVVEARTRLVWAVLNQNYGAGRDLHGTNLNFTILSGASFLGANLSNSILTEAVCEQVNFGKVNLARATCIGCDFFQAMLTNAILTNANFSSTDFTDASLRNSNTNGAIFTNARFSNTIMPNGSIRNF